MMYKHLILKMVLAMSDDDYLFKIYHYILAKYRKAEVIRIVSELESLDIIERAYSFIMGMLSVKKGGVK